MVEFTKAVLLALFVVFGSLGLAGCEEEGGFEQAGEEIDEAGEDVQDEMEDAGDDLD